MAFTTLLVYLFATAAFPLAPAVQASPIGANVRADTPAERSTTVSAMTATQEAGYTPAALFASAAYCPASETITWSCGGESLMILAPCQSCLERISINMISVNLARIVTCDDYRATFTFDMKID